jgi:nucleotide-binding universal stress UspA family protein
MEFSKSKFMVYLDGSDEAYYAMLYGIYLAKTHQSELYGVYNVNTAALDELIRTKVFLEQEREEYQKDMELDADKYLKEFSSLSAAKGVTAHTVKMRGKVQHNIKELIQKHGVDVLIVGELSHVKSCRDEFFNEVDRIIRFVPCSIMIAKNERHIEKLYQSI